MKATKWKIKIFIETHKHLHYSTHLDKEFKTFCPCEQIMSLLHWSIMWPELVFDCIGNCSDFLKVTPSSTVFFFSASHWWSAKISVCSILVWKKLRWSIMDLKELDPTLSPCRVSSGDSGSGLWGYQQRSFCVQENKTRQTTTTKNELEVPFLWHICYATLGPLGVYQAMLWGQVIEY